MRSFYLKPSNEPLQQRHGAFPMFWKDLAAWPGLRDVKKRYLAFQDGVEIPFDQATAPAEAAVVPGDEGEATASAVDERWSAPAAWRCPSVCARSFAPFLSASSKASEYGLVATGMAAG